MNLFRKIGVNCRNTDLFLQSWINGKPVVLAGNGMMGENKMRIADVAREMGLSRATVTLLYKETAQKVDLESIEKLCLLFECQVGDLLELTQA